MPRHGAHTERLRGKGGALSPRRLPDCGLCRMCLDKPKNGGGNTMKQMCERKRAQLEGGHFTIFAQSEQEAGQQSGQEAGQGAREEEEGEEGEEEGQTLEAEVPTLGGSAMDVVVAGEDVDIEKAADV